MKKTTLYHLTPIKNVPSILKRGLLCNKEGVIYFFDDVLVKHTFWHKKKPIDLYTQVSDLIALNQCYLQEYAVFEVNVKGCCIECDDVQDTAYNVYKIDVPSITPDYIKYIGNREVLKLQDNKFHNKVYLGASI